MIDVSIIFKTHTVNVAAQTYNRSIERSYRLLKRYPSYILLRNFIALANWTPQSRGDPWNRPKGWLRIGKNDPIRIYRLAPRLSAGMSSRLLCRPLRCTVSLPHPGPECPTAPPMRASQRSGKGRDAQCAPDITAPVQFGGKVAAESIAGTCPAATNSDGR